jgi:hypothetical protein
MELKRGFGMHRVFPVENVQFCCDALKDATMEKGDFVFTYKSMEEDERDYTCKWHVTCPFCQAALTISQDGMEIDKSG